MILYVTFNYTRPSEPFEASYQTFVVDLPDAMLVTSMGLEIESNEQDPESPAYSRTGRLTIMRTAFAQHGVSTIHTICGLNGDSNAVDTFESY